MNGKKRTSQALARIYDSLNEESRASLFDFAEFLVSRGGVVKQEIVEPLDIPRPDEESVVGAIKRLKQTYPMIESMSVFSEASSLMTDHMINGRDVVEVIDEMEKLFEEFHAQLLKDME